MVSEAGTYNLMVTTENGCTNQTSVTVTAENEVPAITALGGTITCGNTNTQLTAIANTTVTYEWTGPNNFQSTEHKLQNQSLQQKVVY